MFESLKDIIKVKAPVQADEVDDIQFKDWKALQLALSEMVAVDLEYAPYFADWDLVQIRFDILTDEFKARLREMRLRMRKPLITLRRLKHSRIDFISLLFGLCSAESSLILDAYFGASLSRIPSF